MINASNSALQIPMEISKLSLQTTEMCWYFPIYACRKETNSFLRVSLQRDYIVLLFLILLSLLLPIIIIIIIIITQNWFESSKMRYIPISLIHFQLI